MTAEDDTSPNPSSSSADPDLAPRLERLRALRSAWGVLAPAGVGDSVERIAESGRALTDHLSKITSSQSDLGTAALKGIDTLLSEFEESIRQVATDLPVSQLRSTLPAFRGSDRRGLLDLLDVLIGEDTARTKQVSSRIGSIDYLTTLLCTRGDGAVVDDPVSLTPRLQHLCESVDDPEDPRLAEVESEFFAAATLDAEDLRVELQQRTLRNRKGELGIAFFAPRVLRAIVTYNAAVVVRVADELLDAGDWGIVEGEAQIAPSSQTAACSVFESEALREVALAVRRRAEQGEPQPTGVDRIAWALDFDYLEENERKALRSSALGTPDDPLGTAILVGLLSRSLAVLSIELQEVGLSPDELSDVWIDELSTVFQEEINRNIAEDAYQAACALSELKNKFLFAPLTHHLREERAATRPPARPEPEDPPREKAESARTLVQDALERDREDEVARSLTWAEIPWARLARAATALTLVIAAALVFLSQRNPDLSRLPAEELASLSPYLERGQRDGDGQGNAFVGRIDDAWLGLPAAQREAEAQEIVSRLRARGMLQIMIYDADDRIRIQAIGSQPTRTL